MDVEQVEEGDLKSVSCPKTRCSAKEKRGSTASLNKKTTISTFDRISGILASFRDTRKALDESLKKNRQLLEYVDGMETPRSKLNFLPSIFGRSAKTNSKTLLPFHHNELRDVKEDRESHDSEEKQTRTTRNDLEAISTEILNLEKENEPQAKNIKGASPTTKPKLLSQRHKLNNNNNQSHKPLNASARDYGDFDFCVVKEKSTGGKGEKNEESAASQVKLASEESFPRRRRPVNRFQTSSTTHHHHHHQNRERHDSDISKNAATEATTKEGKHIACKTCLCALLLSVSFIVFAMLVLLHPSVQIYIRSHIHYINPLNSPV